MGRNQQDGELNRPEYEVTDHLLCRDANRLGYVVGDIEVGRPDRANNLGHGRTSGIRLDGVPKQGGDGSGDDSELGKVPAEGRSHGDGEGNVESSSHGAVEDERNCADQAAEDDAYNSLAPEDGRFVSD